MSAKDHPIDNEGARVSGGLGMSIRFCLTVLAISPLLAIVSPAWAGDQHQQPIMLAFNTPQVLDSAAAARQQPKEFFSDRDAVAVTELASQRGGSFAVPITQAPQGGNGSIVLWDELKSAQTPTGSVGGNQGTNVITIQVR